MTPAGDDTMHFDFGTATRIVSGWAESARFSSWETRPRRRRQRARSPGFLDRRIAGKQIEVMRFAIQAN
jgi:hypothetical protein